MQLMNVFRRCFKSKLNLRLSLNLSLIVAAFLGCLLVFQNCGRIVISSSSDVNSRNLSLSAADFAAEDIINTMISAGVKDSFEFNDTLDLTAEIMTCGKKPQAVTSECVFTKEKVKFSTSATTAASVKNYLSNIGVARDCATCNDSESYTVTNLKCKRIPNFPRDSTCDFTR